ncbi:MAG TPA: hypothetical protein DCO72_02095 [Ruminococcus sp.]|nr:hypothetical protein [Ruminococcus sp.]
MELKDTIKLMQSADYKDRFKAEYWQVHERCERLSRLLSDYEVGELNFTPKTPIPLLRTQLNIMEAYSVLLYDRAKIEGIELK